MQHRGAISGWLGGWKSPGGGMYRAPYGANNDRSTYKQSPLCRN